MTRINYSETLRSEAMVLLADVDAWQGDHNFTDEAFMAWEEQRGSRLAILAAIIAGNEVTRDMYDRSAHARCPRDVQVPVMHTVEHRLYCDDCDQEFPHEAEEEDEEDTHGTAEGERWVALANSLGIRAWDESQVETRRVESDQ